MTTPCPLSFSSPACDSVSEMAVSMLRHPSWGSLTPYRRALEATRRDAFTFEGSRSPSTAAEDRPAAHSPSVKPAVARQAGRRVGAGDGGRASRRRRGPRAVRSLPAHQPSCINPWDTICGMVPLPAYKGREGVAHEPPCPPSRAAQASSPTSSQAWSATRSWRVCSPRCRARRRRRCRGGILWSWRMCRLSAGGGRIRRCVLCMCSCGCSVCADVGVASRMTSCIVVCTSAVFRSTSGPSITRPTSLSVLHSQWYAYFISL